MTENDISEFTAIWRATFELYSKTPTDAATAIAYRVLAKYDLHAVKAGIEGHIADPDGGRFAPKPADIIRHIPGEGENDGRPTADEAWADALQAEDESATVVWTQETAAAFAVAAPILAEGDKIGARMAFKAAYERTVNEARKNGMPITWKPSLGRDKESRRVVIERAVATGKLTQTHAAAILPAPQDAGPIAGLLTGKITDPPPDADATFRERWADIRKAIA